MRGGAAGGGAGGGQLRRAALQGGGRRPRLGPGLPPARRGGHSQLLILISCYITHYTSPLSPVLSQCCSEFGYCHGRAAWARAQFRDCNGLSNGAALPPAVLAAELREREMGRLAADDQLLGAATENEELIIIG